MEDGMMKWTSEIFEFARESKYYDLLEKWFRPKLIQFTSPNGLRVWLSAKRFPNHPAILSDHWSNDRSGHSGVWTRMNARGWGRNDPKDVPDLCPYQNHEEKSRCERPRVSVANSWTSRFSEGLRHDHSENSHQSWQAVVIRQVDERAAQWNFFTRVYSTGKADKSTNLSLMGHKYTEIDFRFVDWFNHLPVDCQKFSIARGCSCDFEFW
jgi:hypothetical protein